jgi:ABC-2 type transport system ATP-binding protein
VTAPPVEVRDLAFAYGERPALRGVTFRTRPGEVFGLLGPNGGGKTTLFRILCTLLTPASGEAAVFGRDTRRDPAGVRRRIGVVFQAPSLDKKLTVMENLVHQGHLYGLRGPTLRRRAEEALGRFDLTDRAGDRVETLSGGLRRRTEVAKGLLHRPDLLLLDEPSIGLDPRARRDLWDHLGELGREGMSILVTTHLMEEAERCHRLGLLDGGALVAEGTPAALKEEVGGDVVRFETDDPEGLGARLRERFGGEPAVVEGQVRLQCEKGHQFLTRAIEAFPGEIGAAHLVKPGLEDVFLARTGHPLDTEGGKA